jgi:hypothetical protein
MSIIAKLGTFLLGDGNAVAKPIEAFGDAVDKIFTNSEEKLQALAVLQKLEQNPMEWQTAINKIEAQSTSLFKSGWRPCLGWILDVTLALYYIPQFTMATILWVKFCVTSGQFVPYPITELSGLFELVLLMLGAGTLRTIEKFGGITK